MDITSINSSAKAKKKIQSIAQCNNLDYDLVYAIFCFHWNYDGLEGDWVTGLTQNAAYQERYEWIRNKLARSNRTYTKAEVVEQLYHKLTTVDKSSLYSNFVFGATQKNYCFVSEYASHAYLNNASPEKLNTLDWNVNVLNFAQIIKQLFLKIFRGGAIERSSLAYLYVDLLVDLPYLNKTIDSESWVMPFLEKVDDNRAEHKLTDLVKLLKTYCKGDKYFLRTTLEALSYANSLQVENHPVEAIFIPDLRNKLASHFNANEWTYPLRFWNQG